MRCVRPAPMMMMAGPPAQRGAATQVHAPELVAKPARNIPNSKFCHVRYASHTYCQCHQLVESMLQQLD